MAYAIMAASVSDEAITGAKLSSSINIDTTGNISAETYTIKGALNITTGTNKAVGTEQINSGLNFTDVTNSAVTSSSLILLTVGYAASGASANSNGGVKITSVTAGSSFRVGTMDGNAASANIPFSYLIIN